MIKSALRELGEPGAKGDTGATGEAGHTPVKGVDYFTDAESADGWTEIDAPGEDAPEVIAAVDEAISILKGEEQV